VVARQVREEVVVEEAFTAQMDEVDGIMAMT